MKTEVVSNVLEEGKGKCPILSLRVLTFRKQFQGGSIVPEDGSTLQCLSDSTDKDPSPYL